MVADVPIRVLIADDHPVVRQGLAAVFAAQGDIEVVGDAEDIAALMRCFEATAPDVLILDLDLEPNAEDELSALKGLRKRFPQARIIAYTAHEDEDLVVQALAVGVEGYILKSANPQELLKAIRVVNRGGTLLQASVASTLMRHMRCHPTTEQPKAQFDVSRREMDVLRLMGEGKSNQQIADRLHISERTVKFHVSSILNKLEVENRTAAVLKATRNGILAQPVG